MELYCEDCLEVMKQIPNKSIDMILCDLPYGVTRNPWDVPIPLDNLWRQYNRILKDNGAAVLHAQQPFTSALIQSNIVDFKYSFCWYKHQVTNFLNAKKQPLRNTEDIVVFYKRQCTYNPQMRAGKTKYKGTGGQSSNYGAFKKTQYYSDTYYPTTFLDFPTQRYEDGHPTQKPVALLEYLIRTYTNEGDVVLDNCMGSGSTGVACINMGRDFIGIEIDETYFSKAKQRIEAARESLAGCS